MADFFAALWSFMWALISNWIVYMTAVPLVLDDFIKMCSPRLSEWIEKKLTKEKRRKVEIYLMFGGFFIASFMAFDGEHEARKQAETEKDAALKQAYAMSPASQQEEIATLKTKVESQQITFAEVAHNQQKEIDTLKKSDSTYAPRSISDEQKKAFVDALKDHPKGPVAVFIISNAAEATAFANQLRSMLDEAGYADTDNKDVTPSIASLQGNHNPAGSCMAIRPEDEKLPFGAPVQAALIAIGIPAAGTIDTNKALGLKPGEIAVIVQGR